jgi:alpha-tubulin suppressor-like RCC1 family protein
MSPRWRGPVAVVVALVLLPQAGSLSVSAALAAAVPCTASNISGGDTFSTAISNGQLFTWGRNVEGELGLGFTSTQVLTPIAVSSNPLLTNVATVWAGFVTTFAVDPSGQLWAWGDDTNAETGTGSGSSSPVPVSGPSNVVSVGAAHTHTIVVTSDGTVWGWGQSAGLGAGDNSFTQVSPAVLQTPPHVVKVAAGMSRSLILTSDGTLYGAGNNLALGIPAVTFVPTFTQVPNLPTIVDMSMSGSAGSAFSLFIDSTQHVWAVGANSFGQLGSGTVGDPLSSRTPLEVPGIDSVIQVAAGGGHALALKSDGTLWAWGENDSGQLGIGSTIATATPTQVSFPPGTSIVRIAAGLLHSMAVDSQGNIWVWGNDQLGALGIGIANQNQLTPVEITLAASCPGLPPPPDFPVVTGISPNHGPVAGGTSVTVTGSNFTGVTFVSFRAGSSGLQPCSSSNPSPACFTVISDTQIVATSPPMDVGETEVYVANAVGTSALSPADVFTYEGWATPTPADGSTVNAVMANPPQITTISVRLVEAGGATIGVLKNPSWISCGPSYNLTPNTAEVDCQANPTDMTTQTLTFTDANSNRVPDRSVHVDVSHQGYRPIPDGFQFINPTDTSPSFLGMVADYPDSQILYPVNAATTARALAFFELFKSWTSVGLCYGMTATSAYYYNDFPGGPYKPYDKFLTKDSTFPDGSSIKSLVERYYSRQLAEVGAIDAIDQYKKASAAGNMAVFNQLATMVRSGPVTVGIAPTLSLLATDSSRYYDFFTRSHQVVAYDSLQVQGHDPEILVYDPNAPGNDHPAFLDFTSDGGMKLVGASSIPYGDGSTENGKDTDWIAVPVRDFTWSDNSSELVALQRIDNRHWILDALAPLAYTIGDIPLAPIPGVNDVFMAASSSQGGPGLVMQLNGGGGFSAPLTARSTNSVTGEFSGSHVATVTQTDPGAPGSTHSLNIDSTASSVHLFGASSPQQYAIQLGADYLPSYGRIVTLSGLGLSPGTTLDVNTDSAMSGFSVASSGAGQTVTATIEQLGQPASRTTVQVAIPTNGQASIVVFDWGDLAHSLIYETTQVGGVQKVTVLQDNPTQRKAAIDGLFQQLTTAIATIADPSIKKSLTLAVQVAQSLYHHGDTKAAAAVLITVEQAVRALSGLKIGASTAATIIGTSQQIRALM